MKLRLPVIAYLLFFFLIILILPVFVTQVESGTSTNTLYAHAETATIGGVNYYLHKLSSTDGPATTLSQSAATIGRKLMGRWVYPLNGIVSVPASTWTVTYRAMKSSSASSVVAHGDIDILIRKSDNTIRTTIATNVANSPSLTLTNTWQTLTGTCGWTAYTVVDQTDYLEVAYYIEVTTAQISKSVSLRVDDSTLALADQTKIANVMFTYPNQAPVASFTFSPSNPLIYDTVTFDASASYDPDGSIVGYKWDFGDGNITTMTNPIITHVYTTAASTVNYTVTLTVTDNEGLTAYATHIVPVTNPTILRVSLPDGTEVGPNPEDKWLSQCWLLNIAGTSATFTVRIADSSEGVPSNGTHLVIAFNNTAYESLVSLTVNTTTMPNSFIYGTPIPYGFSVTWEGDVYPAWFNDIYIAGDIAPRSYKDVQVSVTFSNAINTKMHFDAYGSTEYPPPTTSKHVTHNPHQYDSTVLFSPPPVVQYYLTVTSPYGIPGGEGWYLSGSIAYATLDTDIVDHGNGTRRVFLYWSGDAYGTNYAQSDPILMNGPKTAMAQWKTQYRLDMSTNFGSTSPSVGPHWYDKDSVVSISATAPSVIDGERYVWLGWTGTGTISYSGMLNPSSVTMNSPITETAAWRHEYLLVMVTNFGTTSPSVGNHWYEAGTVVPIQAFAPSVITGEQYVWNGWTGTGTGCYTGTENPWSVTMDGPISETASWTRQFQITVTASPSEAIGGQFKVAYTKCGTTYTNVYEITVWTEWVDAGTTVTVSEPQDIVNGYEFDHYDPSAGVAMDGAKTITLVYTSIGPLSVTISPTTAKIKVGESVTFTSTVSGGVLGYSYQWYLNGTAVSGATSSTWTFTPATSGTYNVYLNVTDSIHNTAKSNIASVTVAPPLIVSISPTSASILVGQSVTFTSTPSGGYPPYSYQWYLGGVQVSGATSASWTFTPTTSGIYYVYLQVKDANNNIAQSETARITVSGVPVGGYSISLTKQTPTSHITAYTMLIALFGVVLSLLKRKRK